jgi:hypothetical protein
VKPQVRPDQVPLELDDWQQQVVNHLPTLHALAWPQPSVGDLDAPRIQGGTNTTPSDNIDSPPRRLWRNYEDITERQEHWVHHWFNRTTEPMPTANITRWHVFRLVLARCNLDVMPVILWDELHAVLVDMRTVRYAAEKLLRSGPSAGWRPGNTRLPRDQSRYLMSKLHARRVRGMSEVPTEREAGIQ